MGLAALWHVGSSVPQPGMERTSPALEGRFLTTGPPGKSLCQHIALKKKDLFTYLYFWLHWIFFAFAFSSCREQGLLFVVVHGPFIMVASLVLEQGL